MKRATSCEKVLLEHLNANINSYVKKVDLFVIAYEKGGFSPATVDPLLRRMEKAKIIKKDFYDGVYRKNLVQYCLGSVPKKVELGKIINGVYVI